MDGKNIKIKHLEEKPAYTDVRSIFVHVLEMVLPEEALRRYVSLDDKTNILTVDGREYDLKKYERVIVVGGGKAARRTGAVHRARRRARDLRLLQQSRQACRRHAAPLGRRRQDRLSARAQRATPLLGARARAGSAQ